MASEQDYKDVAKKVTDVHRGLAQHVIASGVLSDVQMKVLHKKMVAQHGGEDGGTEDAADYDRCLETVQQSFEIVGMGLTKMRSELDGADFWGLHNKTDDKFAQHASTLQPVEFELFKLMVKAVVESDDGEVQLADLVNERLEVQTKAVSMGQATQLVHHLASQHWLQLSDPEAIDGYTLGVRTFLELPDLLDELNCPECTICSYHVVKGFKCSNSRCSVKLHKHCLGGLATSSKRKKGGTVCPTCKTPWDTVAVQCSLECV